MVPNNWLMFRAGFFAGLGLLCAAAVWYVGQYLFAAAAVTEIHTARQLVQAADQPEPMPTLGTAASAKQHALTFLQKHGVDYLSDSCLTTFKEGAWTVKGVATKEGGAKTDVEVVQRVNQEGNTLRWRVTDATIGAWVVVRER